MDIRAQQLNRLDTIPEDSAISIDFIKALVEAQTGKPVKSVTAMQRFGAGANFAQDNKAFYAINLTIFPL